ncbi:hypothetical protein DIPPA_13552 [Diplonema papillatum]|nr:hypothetical protein DIPPA_13552 [Diplonema papillatum]
MPPRLKLNTLSSVSKNNVEDVVGDPQAKQRRVSYFKGNLWSKVKEFDYMLHTTGNDSNIEALEGAMQVKAAALGLEEQRKTVYELCQLTDSLIAQMKPIQSNQDILDEWEIIRQAGCEMTKEQLSDRRGLFEVPEAAAAVLPAATPVADLEPLLEKLRAIAERLASEPFGHKETQHIAPQLFDRLLAVSAYATHVASPELDIVAETLDTMATGEEGSLQPESITLLDIPADISRPPRTKRKRKVSFSGQDDLVGVPRHLLPHCDVTWTWNHRFSLKKAIRELQESEQADSYESAVVDRTDLYQKKVQLVVQKVKDLTDSLQWLTIMRVESEKTASDAERHLSKAVACKELMMKRCRKDMETLETARKLHEAKYESHSAEHIRKQQAEAALQALQENTMLVTTTFSKLSQLLVERHDQLKKRIQEIHLNARRDGEMEELRRFSAGHRQRLEDFQRVCNEYISCYKEQQQCHDSIIAATESGIDAKESDLVERIVDAHEEHIRSVKTLAEVLREGMEAKKKKIRAVADLRRRFEKERNFCTATGDERGAAIEADLDFLAAVRKKSVKMFGKMAARLKESTKQVHWSLDIISQARGVDKAQLAIQLLGEEPTHDNRPANPVDDTLDMFDAPPCDSQRNSYVSALDAATDRSCDEIAVFCATSPVAVPGSNWIVDAAAKKQMVSPASLQKAAG